MTSNGTRDYWRLQEITGQPTNHLSMLETVPLSWGASRRSSALKCDPVKGKDNTRLGSL